MYERGQRGRQIARALIALAIVYGLLAIFGWIAMPGYMEPMFARRAWYDAALPVLGVASYFLGLAWMIRLYRAKPEPDEGTWRYRHL